jgi:hypothetical protein
MQEVHPDYSGFLAEVLKKYMLFFGPDVVHELIGHLPNLKMLPDGTVTHSESDLLDTTREVLVQLHTLSDVIYSEITLRVMQSYPGVTETVHPHTASPGKTETIYTIHAG